MSVDINANMVLTRRLAATHLATVPEAIGSIAAMV
jgi:hypothetical protein